MGTSGVKSPRARERTSDLAGPRSCRGVLEFRISQFTLKSPKPLITSSMVHVVLVPRVAPSEFAASDPRSTSQAHDARGLAADLALIRASPINHRSSPEAGRRQRARYRRLHPSDVGP